MATQEQTAARPGPARPRGRLHRARRPRARREFAEERTGATLEHVVELLVRPGDPDAATSSTSSASRRCRSASPARCSSTASTRRASSTSRWRPPRARSSRRYNRGMRLLLRGRRRHDDDPRRPHAARAGVPVPERARGARRSASGSTSTSTRSRRPPRRRRRTGQAAGHRAVLARAGSSTRASTTRPATPRARTSPARRPQAACKWIVEQLPGDRALLPRVELRDRQEELAGQHAASTRGKRVVAEATIPNELFERVMRSNSELMFRARQVSNLGGFMSGVNNNGAHSANGITAMFIATGQDAANVAESSRRVRLRRAAPERRLLLLGHDPVADRRHLRRRHRPGDPARVPRAARLLRQGQGAQVRRDRRGDRAVRRAVARLGDRRRGVGRGPRPLRPQPPVTRADDAQVLDAAVRLDVRVCALVGLDGFEYVAAIGGRGAVAAPACAGTCVARARARRRLPAGGIMASRTVVERGRSGKR